MAGMLVAATSAAVASFTGLRGLALLSGWPERAPKSCVMNNIANSSSRRRSMRSVSTAA
ncbi:hypothetical protein [Dactylosporangium sp. CA-233914]|uniref:hypothetical protein n=1 Tax=Dactylosporangium sp. CA-233914 TaxID=3239934 RepID=UPI003D8FD444